MSMLDAASVQYAIENTAVIHAPERRIDTFGSTSFRFFLVTEMMDSVNEVRIRDGRFCLIDFELATLLPGHESLPTKP